MIHIALSLPLAENGERPGPMQPRGWTFWRPPPCHLASALPRGVRPLPHSILGEANLTLDTRLVPVGQLSLVTGMVVDYR